MPSLKNNELNCIRFYMGDPDVQNEFRGGLKAYNTINALLHSGIQNEIDLVNENRTVEIYDINHLKQYIDIIISISKSMNQYLNEFENHHFITYKIDRLSTILQMKNNYKIEGYFSTCKYRYLEEYAHIKKEVILLEIVRDKSVPYLDFEKLFKEKYAKPDEAEILIPFNTQIDSIQEIELTPLEIEKYYDMNGNSPVGKYRIHLINEDCKIKKIDESILFDEFKHVQSCISTLMNDKKLNEEDLSFYTKWKEDLKTYILYKIFE